MKKLIIDTGPMLEYVLARHLEGSHRQTTSQLAKNISHLDNRPALSAFRRFLGSYPIRMTSVGVTGELYRHFCTYENMRSLQRQDKVPLWETVLAIWRELKIEEKPPAPLIDSEPRDLAEVGPVDLALIELARGHSGTHDEVAILTIESQKWSWMRRQVSAVTIQEAIERGKKL